LFVFTTSSHSCTLSSFPTGRSSDLVDVDDAALGRLDVEVGGVEQLQEQVRDVLADVAGFGKRGGVADGEGHVKDAGQRLGQEGLDRRITRLNSSHVSISYAVFCLKK